MQLVDIVVCVVGVTTIAVSAISHSHEVQLDWKNALLPCTCLNDTVDCSYRRKVNIEAEDVCVSAPTSLSFYDNLFVNFPDGFSTVTSVNGSRNLLNKLPRSSQIHPRLKVLDLSRNVISSATDELRDLSFLEILDLNTNKLSHLRFLPASCSLRRMDVSHNALTDLEGPLRQCTQLKELDLKNNELNVLPDHIFSEMRQLEILRLEKNSIGNGLTSQIFDNLTKLKELDLYSVDLTNMPRGIFKSLSKLEKLDIGNNDLSSLPEDVFSSLSSLKTLRMMRGNMHTFPTEIFSPIPHLETLHLSVNFFTTLPYDAFTHLPRLKTLTLSFLNATFLPRGIFSNLTELKVLSLYGNHLTFVPNCLLSGLDKLETIDLSANRWTELPLQEVRNVKELFLGNLGINSLGPRMFSATPRVKVLGVHFNNISSVAENAFDGLTLQGLLMEKNALEELPVNVFQGQVQLKVLDLSRNVLTNLPEGIFSGLNNLVVLQLADNRLHSLPNHIFQHLDELELLDLSGNQLTAVNAGLFTNLRSLRQLAMQRNRLSVLPSVSHVNARLHVSFKGNVIIRPEAQLLLQWLNGEDQTFMDLTDNNISPAAVHWLANEQQLRLGTDALSPCNCGYVRHRRALLRLCVNTNCAPQHLHQAPHWVEVIRNARE